MPLAKTTALLLFLILLAPTIRTTAFAESPGDAEGYSIGASDVIEVFVYDHPELSKSLSVSPDGYISFPLIGRIEVNGLSVTALQTLLENKLGEDYLVNPQVSLIIKEYRSQKVYVLGEVSKPGLYEISGPTTLLEAISRAGGLSELAGKRVLVTHPGQEGAATDRKKEPIMIDLTRLLEAGDTSLNLLLDGGDVVHVPRANSFYVLGEIQKPGIYTMAEGMTILRAITMAGGFTKFAAAGRTKVIRVREGKEETIVIDMNEITKKGDRRDDIHLQPDDMIIVPESFF